MVNPDFELHRRNANNINSSISDGYRILPIKRQQPTILAQICQYHQAFVLILFGIFTSVAKAE